MISTTYTTGSDVLLRRGLRLAYFTIGWDVVEGVVAVAAGIIAGSIVLLGFGIDSAIEVFAASVVVWQLRRPGSAGRQRAALRLIAVTFCALAAYVSFESVQRLVEGAHPEPSVIGIVMNLIALVVMIPLARMKRRTGEALGNDVLLADAAETRLSNYLSVNVLAGLSLNALLGWWWADPAAALVIAAYAAWTGWTTWRESGEGERRVVAGGRR